MNNFPGAEKFNPGSPVLKEITLPDPNPRRTINKLLDELISSGVEVTIGNFDPRWAYWGPNQTVEGWKAGVCYHDLTAWIHTVALQSRGHFEKEERKDRKELFGQAEQLSELVHKMFAGCWKRIRKTLPMGYVVDGPRCLVEKIEKEVVNATLFQLISSVQTAGEILEARCILGKYEDGPAIGVVQGNNLWCMVEIPHVPSGPDGKPVEIATEEPGIID